MKALSFHAITLPATFQKSPGTIAPANNTPVHHRSMLISFDTIARFEINAQAT